MKRLSESVFRLEKEYGRPTKLIKATNDVSAAAQGRCSALLCHLQPLRLGCTALLLGGLDALLCLSIFL